MDNDDNVLTSHILGHILIIAILLIVGFSAAVGIVLIIKGQICVGIPITLFFIVFGVLFIYGSNK